MERPYRGSGFMCHLGPLSVSQPCGSQHGPCGAHGPQSALRSSISGRDQTETRAGRWMRQMIHAKYSTPDGQHSVPDQHDGRGEMEHRHRHLSRISPWPIGIDPYGLDP